MIILTAVVMFCKQCKLVFNNSYNYLTFPPRLMQSVNDSNFHDTSVIRFEEIIRTVESY